MKSRLPRTLIAVFLSIGVLGWWLTSSLSPFTQTLETDRSSFHPTTIQSNQHQSDRSINQNLTKKPDQTGQLENQKTKFATDISIDETQEKQLWQSILNSDQSTPTFQTGYFTQAEIDTLRDLPTICTSQLPGISFDRHQQQMIGSVSEPTIALVDYETPIVDDSPQPTQAFPAAPPEPTNKPSSGYATPIGSIAQAPTPASYPPAYQASAPASSSMSEPELFGGQRINESNLNAPAGDSSDLDPASPDLKLSSQAVKIRNQYSDLPSSKMETRKEPTNLASSSGVEIESMPDFTTSRSSTDSQGLLPSSFPSVPESVRVASRPPSTLEEAALAAEQKLKQQQQFDAGNYNPHANAVDLAATMDCPPGVDPHAEVFAETPFPSAVACAKCHEQIFEEWSSSSHAYASISPMFHRFEDTINKLAQGTIGYFCMRCHAPVATTMGLRRDQPIFDGPRVFREGVTCVACHRVKNAYTKSNGERRIEPGDIYSPVYGGKSSDGSGVATVTKYDEYFKVKTNPNDKRPGQPIHYRSIQFEELSKADFCMSCHQVAVQPGIKLEVVWDQYRASPAYREGTTCQDCHMGRVPGVNGGYTFGPAAVVDQKVVNPERKHSNHVFYGPGYSIAHPGIFPHNEKADKWKVEQWLEFDWRAGWGTEKFEDAVADGLINPYFPPTWQETDDRYDAREIVDANLKKLLYKKDLRRQVMENGSKLDGPFFSCEPQTNQPLKFNFVVSNLNPGHNLPSGSLGAQPQLWLNVVLVGPDGQRLWESGDLDSSGDLRDIHSVDVGQRKVPLDKQLFNLQTKFLTTNAKGTDREIYLPINLDVDQLPFIRPAIQPVSTLNHPPLIRMEGHSIPPLGARKAKYVVPADVLQMPGTYRLSFRLRSRAEPIYFMRFVLSTPEMIRMMNEWIVDVHSRSVIFEVR